MLTNKFLPSELRPSPLGRYVVGSTSHVASLAPPSLSIRQAPIHRSYQDSEYEILSSCDPSPRQIQKAQYYEQGRARLVSPGSYQSVKPPAITYRSPEPPAPVAGLAAVATTTTSSSLLSFRPTPLAAQNATCSVMNSSSQNNGPILSRQLSVLHENVAPSGSAAAHQDCLEEAKSKYLSARGRVSANDRQPFKDRENALYEKEIDLRLREYRLTELRAELKQKRIDLEKRVEQLNAQITYNESEIVKVETSVDRTRVQRTTLETTNHKTALKLKRRQDREEALALQLIKTRSVMPQTESDILRSKRLTAPIMPMTPTDSVGVTIVFDSASQTPVAVSSSRMAANLF